MLAQDRALILETALFLETAPTQHTAPRSSGPRLIAPALCFALTLAACGGPTAPGTEPPCAAEQWQYSDQRCGLLQDGGQSCEELGDGLCYQRCEQDSECGGGLVCTHFGLYAGGDGRCNQTVKICRSEVDSCSP